MNKILVIQTASIGDVILTTPVVEHLHRRYPEGRIDLLVKKGMEGLFHDHPIIRKLILWDKSRKYRGMGRVILEIRKEGYDQVINLQRFFLTGLATVLSGAGKTTGFDKNPLSFLFKVTVKHEFSPGIHEAGRNLSLILPLPEAVAGQLPRLYPSEADDLKTAVYKGKPYVTVSPASLWFTKQFPAEKWIGLISRLPQGISAYLLGSQSDRKYCEKIMQEVPAERLTNLAGKLSFLESASLMKDAMMNYTNDSAPMHLASAVNAPVAAVFCSTVPGFGFGPLSEVSHIIQTNETLSCRPCGIHGHQECPEKHFRCATSISIDQFPLTGNDFK